MAFSSTTFHHLRTLAILLVATYATADVTYNPSWEFQCAPAGQNSTATFRLTVTTDEFTNYTILTNVMWGDQFSEGKTHNLVVGQANELVYHHAFEATGSGREHVKMKTDWISPEDAMVFPKDPMSSYGQIVDITENECILVETESPTVSPAPSTVSEASPSPPSDASSLLPMFIVHFITFSIAFLCG